MKKGFIKIGLACAVLFLFSCSSDEESKTEEQILAESSAAKVVKIDKAVYDELIQLLPQPIEVANIVNQTDMPFSKEMLIPSGNTDRYENKYEQAMAFGSYGVDLGYINLNDKEIYVLEYLESVKDLSKALKVDQFFDFSTLYELTKNRHNTDSLIYISTKNFNQIDEYLREQNRGELSVLILIGAWVEGIHMFGELYKKDNNKLVLDRIGEQKVVFENMLVILDRLSEIKYYADLKKEFMSIKSSFDSVKITYIRHEPEMKEVNGALMIIDNTETKIDITNQNAMDIIASIENFRNKRILKK